MSAAASAVPPRTAAIFQYFTPLTLLVFLILPNGYLLDIATSFMLKNSVRASPEQVANFRLLTAVPVYLSFCFGLARDLWNPFGLKDRGLLMIFGGVTAVLFLYMSTSPLSYSGLLVCMLLVMFSFSFVAAAARGLLALVSQEQLISGRLSALWNALSSVPYVFGAFASGYLAAHFSPGGTFLLVAALSFLIAVFGIWKPRAVFNHAYDHPIARGTNLIGDLKRLVKHRAAYPAVLLVCLCQFSPGFNTPLQFYLTGNLQLSDAVYASFQGILIAGYIPAAALYGYLCKRRPLRTLLWWAACLWLPAAIPLLIIHSAASALWVALAVGLAGGFTFTAFWDLALRSCPAGMQGALMMMVAGMYELAYRGGDFIGTQIYTHSSGHGFLYCVAAGTVTSALVFPVLLMVPKKLIATSDGECNPEDARSERAERAGSALPARSP